MGARYSWFLWGQSAGINHDATEAPLLVWRELQFSLCSRLRYGKVVSVKLVQRSSGHGLPEFRDWLSSISLPPIIPCTENVWCKWWNWRKGTRECFGMPPLKGLKRWFFNSLQKLIKELCLFSLKKRELRADLNYLNGNLIDELKVGNHSSKNTDGKQRLDTGVSWDSESDGKRGINSWRQAKTLLEFPLCYSLLLCLIFVQGSCHFPFPFLILSPVVLGNLIKSGHILYLISCTYFYVYQSR